MADRIRVLSVMSPFIAAAVISPFFGRWEPTLAFVLFGVPGLIVIALILRRDDR